MLFVNYLFYYFYCSIFTEGRLERLTEGIALLDSESSEDHGWEQSFEGYKEGNLDSVLVDDIVIDEMLKEKKEFSQFEDSDPGRVEEDQYNVEHTTLAYDSLLLDKRVQDNFVVPVETEAKMFTVRRESSAANTEVCETVEARVPNAVLNLLRYYQYDSSDSSPRYNLLL